MILAVVVVAALVVVLFVTRRRSRTAGISRARGELAVQLMHTGRKARAMITALQPTGMVVNNINVQCIVHFHLEPLDGDPAFDAQKKMLISRTTMPQVGEMWPSWFDPDDLTRFAVGQPTAVTPDQVGLFRDFGIPHPLERRAS